MKNRKNKGFTLVELIATLGILSIVLTAVFNVLDSGNMMYIDGLKKDNVQSSARLAETFISQAIKTSRICILADGNPNFSSIDVGISGKRLLYVESTDNTRFMYVIEVNGSGLKELHKLSFNSATAQKYILQNPIIAYEITPTDSNLYNLSSNVSNIVTLDDNINNIASPNYIYNRIDTSVFPDFNNNYYTNNAKLLYESFGDRCYLWVTSRMDGKDYRLVITPVNNTDYTVTKDEKICDYISDIDIYPDSPITDKNQITQPVTNLNIYKLNIDIKTQDRDKTKELTTSSYILNYRGGM